MQKKLNKFIISLPDFNSAIDTIKVLFLSFFFTEELKNPQVVTADLKKLYQLANLSLPQNFGGEIKNLLKTKRLTKTKSGYKLNVAAKEWVKSQIVNSVKRPIIKNRSSNYVNLDRINELRSVNSASYDLSRLVKLCEELNIAFQNISFLSIPMLVRAIVDHIPPIFVLRTFTEVTNNYGTKSFKESMTHLDNSSRKIADAFLHTPIRSKEVLPNYTQIDFSNDLDLLLAEIYRILK